MKKVILSAIIISGTFIGKGQNLVPNGDFETYSPCPAGYGQLDAATSWFNPATLSPDYFNVCAGINGAGVPDNAFGYQQPHSGNGYAGIYGLQFPYVDVREYACAQLTQPLVAGISYLVEYYVNLSESSQYAVVTYGAYLAPTSTVTLNGYLINAVPQIENTISLLTDTLGWMLISGTYVAAGGEQYIIVGSFRDDSNCGAQPVSGGLSTSAYYFLDDVSVTTLTSIEEQPQNSALKIFPNPVGEEFLVSGLKFPVEEKTVMKIYDALGKEAQPETRNLKPGTKINVSTLKKGIYFIEINDGKNIYRKKFIKE